MSTEAQRKYEHLRRMLSKHKRVVVSLSGGLDSSFLLYAAVDTLGPANVFAAIGVSPSLAQAEHGFAVEYCTRIGLADSNVITVETRELENPDYRRNDANRCFFCKQELCGRLQELAKSLDVEVVCDGANASDLGDYRPGRVAAQEAAVRSPLLEAGLYKEEIRELAEQMGLEIWDKPQSACLASRIPYNSEVTVEKLRQVERAEEYLRSLGFRQLRVRHHGNLARIELPLEDARKALENGLSGKIVERFRHFGFLFTTIDVGGFKSGSMNIMLKGGADV